MNRVRRAQIDEIIVKINTIKEDVEDIRAEEDEYLENIPDCMVNKRDDSIAALEAIEEALDNLDAAIDSLEESKR